MQKYLQSSEYINWNTPAIIHQAARLSRGLTTDVDMAKKCFDWVRDEIKHSWDHQLNPVTCKASDVLKYKTGYCYAKSHLLAALLRANGIPAGLCYQRLSINDNGAPYCLHGLNSVYLNDFGWYRIDARGNRDEICAGFTPPEEQLAFAVNGKQERDFSEIWAEPVAAIIEVLTTCHSIQDVYNNLPDIEISIKTPASE